MEKDILRRLENMIGECGIGPVRTLKTDDLSDVLYDAHQEIALLRQALGKITTLHWYEAPANIARTALGEEKKS
jgi:hypothetical protein